MSKLDAIRNADGTLPAYSSLGSYPILYLDRGNNILCNGCAEGDEDNPAIEYTPHFEGEPETCDQCGMSIDSAYGVPE